MNANNRTMEYLIVAVKAESAESNGEFEFNHI